MIASRSLRSFGLMLIGYACLRTIWLWGPDILRRDGDVDMPPIARCALLDRHANNPPFPAGTARFPARMPVMADPAGLRLPPASTPAGPLSLPSSRTGGPQSSPVEIARGGVPAALPRAHPPRARSPAVPASPVAPTDVVARRAAARAGRTRWSGYAYLFHRADGDAATLAPAGQIGGSQAAARIAYRIDAAGRVALAARIAMPLRATAQAEAAIGADLVPLPGLRLSIERRIAIGRQGRDAFAAYAAGGLYRMLAPRIALDGYAQAGIVDPRAPDPFADGAIRVAHRTPVAATVDVHVGAGLWGAAQPGAARLDLGPRVAFAIRTPHGPLTIAAEGRVRIAGRARPGNGLALGIGTDF